MTREKVLASINFSAVGFEKTDCPENISDADLQMFGDFSNALESVRTQSQKQNYKNGVSISSFDGVSAARKKF